MNYTEKKDKILYSNFLCFFAVALFSLSFPINEILLQTWDIFSLLFFRNSLALIFLFLFWYLTEDIKKTNLKDWIKGLTIGAIGFGFGTTLIVYCQIFSGPVIAALAAAMMPLAGVILEYLFDYRKITFSFITAIILVIVGGIIATGINLDETIFNFGIFLGILASFFFAWGSRKTVVSLNNIEILGQTTLTATGMLIFSSIIFFLSKLFNGEDFFSGKIELNEFSLLIFYSLFCLAISQVLWIKGVKLIGIGIASFHLNITPFYVMIILIFLGYDWSWLKFLGALIVFFGIIISQINLKFLSSVKFKSKF